MAGKTMTFDDFWSTYPRKIAKGAARRAWNVAVRKASPETIITGVSRYMASLAAQKAHTGWAPDVCHPATWLNGERWLDQPEHSAPGTNGRAVMESRADAIRRGLFSAGINDHSVREMISAGLITAEQARKAGYLL